MKRMFNNILCISLIILSFGIIFYSLIDSYQYEIFLGDSNLIGDVDGNGKVGAADYILVRKHIIGTSKLSGEKLTKADVNNDSKVSTQDYIALRKIIINGNSVATQSPKNNSTPTPVVSIKPTAAPAVTVAPVVTSSPKVTVNPSVTTLPTVKPTPMKKQTKYNKRFEITHYWGLFAENMNDAQIQYLRDAGFTLIWVQGNPNSENHAKYVEAVGKALNKLNEYGMRAMVLGWWGIFHYDNPNETQSTRLDHMREALDDFSKYPNVVEYYVTDEPPNSSYFKDIAEIVDLIRSKDPGANGYVNLLPNGAQEDDNYKRDYLTPFAKTVNSYTISFDKYIFGKSGGVDKGSYYSNLEDVYNVGEQYGRIPTSIVLLTEHANLKNVTKNEIAFQVSVSLAFGMKRISYFTYSIDGLPSDYKNAFLDKNHNRTNHYYDVQSVNKWASVIGNQLFDKNSVGVFGFNESSKVLDYNKYSKDITANKAGLIAMFSDKSYMLVNTEIASPVDNTFTFSSMNDLSYYDTVNNKWVKITKDVSNSEFKIYYNKKQIVLSPGYNVLLKGGNYWKHNSSENWKKDTKGWHYYDPNGTLVKSAWIYYKGDWYYIDSSGTMLTGWQKLAWNNDTNWYYFDENGVMLTGWQKLSWNGVTSWYYFEDGGAMVANKCITIKKEQFCFNSSGACTKGSGC